MYGVVRWPFGTACYCRPRSNRHVDTWWSAMGKGEEENSTFAPLGRDSYRCLCSNGTSI